MDLSLTVEELVQLVQRVFKPGPNDRGLAILIDFPDEHEPDTPAWKDRRELAFDWFQKLAQAGPLLGLESVKIYGYRNVRANNADLPHQASELHRLPENADQLPAPTELSEVFRSTQIFLVPTRFSATAPMKVQAKLHGFRAATMPGFTRAMLPALALDYEMIHRRVLQLKELVDRAESCQILFQVEGAQHHLTLDLRHRTGHASGGLVHQAGTAGNLPSGETYIVPYEGENEPSRSRGELPVQFGQDVVLYQIEENKAVAVATENRASLEEKRKLAEEPAYGNLAELGLGVLGDLGIEPTGVVLLDEKLGLHIAFGRSEHFGGQVGPSDFSRPERVVHIDRVYLPQIQPKIHVAHVDLVMPDGTLRLMQDGCYQLEWT